MKSRDLPEDLFLTVLILGKPPSLIKERLFKEGLYLERIIFLSQHIDQSFSSCDPTHNYNIISVSHDGFNLGEGLEVGKVLVFHIHNMDSILIGSIVLLISFLEQ